MRERHRGLLLPSSCSRSPAGNLYLYFHSCPCNGSLSPQHGLHAATLQEVRISLCTSLASDWSRAVRSWLIDYPTPAPPGRRTIRAGRVTDGSHILLLWTEKRPDQRTANSYSATMWNNLLDAMLDPVTILVSIVVFLFLAKVYNSQKHHRNFPPGPKPLPIIGNVLSIDMTKPQETFMEFAKTYGTVYSISLGMRKMVVLCGYDTIKEALINHAEELSYRPRSPLMYKISKNHGLIFSNGDNWKVMRRFTLSTLRDYGMGKKTTEDKISEEAEYLIERFRSYKGKPFDNHTIMNAAVANIIVAILLSRRFDYDDPTIKRLVGLIDENVKVAATPLARMYDSFPFLVGLIGGQKKVIDNNRELQGFLQKTFTKYRDELDVNNPRNLIDTFLAKQQEGKPESKEYFHDDNLTILLDNLFGAGMETTSTTLRWGILLMMKYPEIQKKVKDEIERVIGSVQPRLEHRKQMPYTDAVIHEIQRYGDILPGNVPHATTKDINLRGYDIPKGTMVIPLLTSALRDEAYFQKPNEFYPEHFLDAQGNFKKNEAFIPFSLGKRSCAGETLARMELFLFFTGLLQNFTFQAAPGAVLDLTPALGITSAPLPYDTCAVPCT